MELLERVGLTEAADRKVGGYSGGMKRRLDLALALVHRPRVLFLDEPTTGLDPQSRTALWEEVARLAREDGVTVFLTTQYLEEADVLADRVGIIDNGRIVAEGTPTDLKAEIGRPERARDRGPVAGRGAHRRASRPVRRAARKRRASPCDSRPTSAWRTSCAGSTPRASQLDDIELRAPTLDDVFLAKTGRTLEGAAGVGGDVSVARGAGRCGRRPLDQAHATPAGDARSRRSSSPSR